MTSRGTEPTEMAQVQKTLRLHEDVARLIQAYADKKGTTFQRVVQSAALNFFFSTTEGPPDEWLTAFVELEKGAGNPPMDLSNVPVKFYEDEARRLEAKLERVRRSYALRTPKTEEHAAFREQHLKSFQNAIDWAHGEAGVWRSRIDDHGGTANATIECAIMSWSEHNAELKRWKRVQDELDAQADDE